MALRKLVSSLWTILLGIVVLASLPASASSSIPQFFNYQGRLLTSGGTNVTDGTYAIKFSLYDAATGGTPIWTASGTTGLPTALNVTVTNGLFSVLLGDASFQSQNSLSSLDWDQDGLYLGITVGSDSEMTPRKKLSSVPFALNAGQLQGQYASSSVASTGGNLFEVHQTTADSASAQRTALSIKTEGTNNSNDFLIVGRNDSSDVFTVSRQGSVTTTGNLASNGNVTLGDTTSDRVVFNAYVMSDVLPATDLAYRLGDSSHRWLGLDVGTVTTTNLFATTVSSTNALFANATTTNLYSTTVSTTQLFVNGQAISSGVPATTATLQAITQNGASTTNRIYAFGGIDTLNLTATGTTSLQNTTLTNATATAVTSTNLFSTFGTITTLGSTYLTATQATATTLAFTSASGSSLLVAGQNVCLANGTNCQAMPSIPAGSYVWTDDPANNLVYNTTSTRSVRLGSQATTTVIAQMPSPNYVGNNAAGLMVFLDNNNVYWWGPYNTELRVEKLVGGVGTNDLSHVSITPSPVWLRVRIDQMRVAFDYSTDGSNYTNQWNQNLDFTPIGVGLFHKNFGGSNIIQSYDYLEVNGRMVDGFNDGSLGGDWVSYVPSGSITESSGSLNINNGGDWWAGVANAPYAYIPFSKLDAYVLAQFLYVPGTATSTVMIGSDVTTNLLVGTTTYGGGLNSNFQVNGNDVYAQGMIGSQEGLFSATGVTVGLGTTVYGDGNLYKTNAGDFTLALNNAASNWRFRTGSQESFTVASTGNVGIGVSTPLEALDVSGTIRNVLRSGQVFDTLSTISGITNPTNVRVQGGYAYVATAGGYLRVYDVSNPVSPAYLNQVSFGGNAYTARVSGRYAYVVNDSGSALKVIDISNPSSPVVSGSVTTNSAPRGLYVDGRYAYVANTTANSLQIVDISNPTNPVIIKTIASVSTGPKQVVKSGRYAYLVSITSNDFKVIDVADPSNAVVVGTVAVGSYPNDIAINGRYAYVANYSSDSVSIVDIANVAAPSVVGTISLLATDGPSDIMVSGRYLYVTNYDSGSIYIYDISNPTSPVQITKKTTGAATWGIDVVGGTAYVASYSAGTVTLIDLKGTETSALQAHSAELGSLSVLTSASIYNQMNVGGSLTVGPGGLLSQGSLAISSTNTTSTFVFAVSSTNMEVSNRLTVGGRTVCLENGTNCPAAAVIPGGAYAWSDDNASNTFYNTTSSRDVLIGGSTTATANFMIDKDGATSTVIVGGSTGNANLLVGTAAYGNTLDSSFVLNGNDVYAQGMIGSLQGMYSATGVRVGTGATVYGDGYLYSNPTTQLSFEGFESGSFGSGWTTGGDANWAVTEGMHYSGFRSASSGHIAGAQNTWLDYDFTASANGVLKFMWKVSSEANYDFLLVCVDNDAGCTRLSGYLARISGEVDWTQVSIPLAAGNHSIRWLYANDGGYGPGYDAGWVDDVSFSEYSNYSFGLNDAGSSFRISSGGRESVAVASSGNVGIGVSTPLEALDVSGTVSNLFRNAQPLTTVTSTLIGGSQAARVVVSGKYAYVTDKNGGTNPALRILDITNPRVPSLVGSLVIDVQPIAISVNGNYAYITHENGANYGFTVVDVSNPTAPYRVSRVNLGSSVWSQKILGNYAYLGTGVTNKRLIILDISNPASPVEVGSLNLGSDTVYGLDVQGRYAYVNMYGGGTMRVVDVANPAAPVQVGSVSFPNTGIYGVAVQGRYAYVGNGGNNLMYVVDISNPASPTLVKTVSTGMHGPWYLKVDGRYLYVANYNTGGSAEKLIVFDITSSTNPVMAAYSAAQGGATGLWDVAVSGRYAYTTEYAGTRLSVIDLEGVEVSALSAHSAELGSLSVLGDASIFNRLTLGGGLNIGPNGLLSQGALAISSTTTVSKFLFAVSSTNMEVSNALTVGGQSVCLQDGTNCVSGPSPWTESAASNTVITAAEGRNLALVTDKGTVTPPSSTYAAVVRVTNTGLVANNQLGLVLYRDRSNFYMWGPSNGGTLDLALAKVVNDTGASIYATTSKGLPVWLRIRYAAPTAYFDYSTDGVTFYNATSLTSEITPFAMGPFHKNWGGTNVTASFDDFSLNDFSDGFTGTNLGPAWSQYAGTGSINISGGTLNLVNGGDWWSGTAENAPHTLAYFANVAGVFVDAERGNVHFGYNTNTNLYVGTSTYGGGLNSAFTLNGNDIIAQGAIGSIEGMFSATGVRVGTGTTVYGDGNLYKTTAGDFTLALNDAGSSYRLYSGGQEAMTVASSGNIGIGVANPSEALDVEGGIDSSYGNTTFKMVYSKSPVTQFGNCGGSIPESTKQGHFMYVICGNDLFIFDISDPLSPRYTGTAARPDQYSFVGVEVRGNLLYAAVSITSNGTTALEIWDVSNPSVPRWITTVNGGGTYFSTDSIELNGNYAYLGFTNGYYVFDIKNPYSPQWVRTITLSDRVNGFAFNDRYMYTVSYNRLLSVWGLSDPSNPNLLYSTTTGDASNVLDNITIYGKYAYIQQQNAGKILIFDITNPTYPKWLSTHSASSPSIVDVDGRYLYYYTSGDSINYALDVSNPYSPVIVGRGAPTSLYATRQISGRYMYVAGTYTNPYFFQVVDLRGSETSALSAASAEIGQLRTNEMSVGGRLSVFNGLWASNGNISMDGAMVVMATGTTSTFYAYVSSTNGNFTDRLTVGGQRVCLESGGGCASGALAWTEDAASNILRPNNTGRDVLLGGSTSATAGFIFDKGVTTSTVIVVSGLNVGATVYSGGLNSAFATNGNDIFASGKIGSLQGMYSATGVRVGLNTTVYGDGNLYGTGKSALVYSEGFESGSFGSGWTTGGNASWAITTEEFYSGIRSASSGKIGASGNTWLDYDFSTTAPAGFVQFWWKTNSEANYDFLEVCIDSDALCDRTNYYSRISGSPGWTLFTVPFSGSGSHSVRWLYTKDGSGDTGKDAGWVDGVEIYTYDDYRWTLNDPASNWRFNAGGQEAFMVASSGVVGLGGHYDSRYALDVWGNIDNTLQSTARIHSIYSSTTPASMYGNAAVLGDYAYVPNITASGWLSVIDIKNPANPKIVGAVNTGSGSNNVGVLADAGYVYLFGRTGATLYVVDVTRPSNPRVISTLGGFSNHYGHLAKSGRYLYVGDYGSNSVKVVDVGNPAAPAIVGSASITGSGANSAAYQGGYVFSANYTNGTLSAVDVTNAASPRLISSLSLGTANPSAVVVSGRYAYVSHVGSSNLEVVDITNPASMRVVKVFAMAGQSNYDNSSMDIKGHYLYAPIGIGSTIQVVDVASSTNPVSMGTFSTGGNPMSVVVQGKYAHVYSLSGYRIHDIQGIETGSLTAASAEFGALNANGLILSGQLTVGGGLSVGMSGMRSLGSLAISSTNTTSTFSYAVSATQARFSRQLTADQFLRVDNTNNADIAAQISGSVKNVPTTGQTYKLLYSTSTDGYLGGLDIQANYLITQSNNYFRTLDITQPALPKVVGSIANGGTGYVGDMHVRGRYAYGTRSYNNSVDIYDLSNPGAPTFTSQYNAGSTVRAVAVEGNYLYYTRSGFFVQNIANPTSQAAVSSAWLPGTPNSVVVQGNYAYVTNDSNYLHVIDISNKLRPVVMSTTTVATAYDVAVQGKYAYVGNGSNVLVYDVGNPASPTLVKTVALGSGTVYQMVVDGDSLHVAAETQYAQIDISDPANAFVNGNLALTTVRKIAVKGRYAYLGTYTSPGNLYVIDVKGMATNALAAQSAELGSLQVQGSMRAAADFTVNGALFAGRGGIMSNGPLSVQSTTTAATVYASTNDFYDLGAPDKAFRDVRSSRTAYLNNVVMSSSTTQLYSTSYPPTIATSTFLAGSGPQGTAVRGNYLYVGNVSSDSLTVYDVSDKTWPKMVGSVALTAGFDPFKLVLNGDYAYILNYNNSSFSVINISRPSNPTLVRTVSAYSNPTSLALYGKYLYVAFGVAANGLAVYDISDPANPRFQRVLSVTGGNPFGIKIQGHYAYLALNNGASTAGTLKVYDLAEPTNPAVAATLTLTGNNGAYELEVQGKYTYVLNYDTGTVSIINIANPASPSVISSPNIGTTNNGIAVSGRYIYVTQYSNNVLKIVDVQNPASASVVATVNTSAAPRYLSVSGRYAYIPAYTASKIDIVDLHGYETESLDADSAEMGTLSVLTNASIDGSLDSGGSLVISDSWMSQGSLAISSTNTTSTFLYAVSATAGEFSGRLTVGGVSVCLKDTTNCRDWYTGVWQDDANGNLVYPSSTVRDIMFGGSTTATAGFIFDRGVTTSTVLIGNQTGNANLLVGTTTYGGGLNSAFATNGNDIFAQGMIGSLEGLYSATGVRVGTGTSVYGDGTLWKTTNGDFNLNAFTFQESFESVTFPPNSNWSTGGDANWVRTTATSTDGSASASSSKMLDNQLEWLDYRFNSTMSGQVTFKWKVSSEANWDFLAVCMDQLDSNCTRVGSGRYAYISGVTNWASVTVPFTGAGSHKIRWIYAKDSSQSLYLDAGWVDDVRINSGWRFYAGGSERLTVASSGNIGIGVATPLSTLDMTGNIDLTLHTTVSVPMVGTLTVGTSPEDFVIFGKYAAIPNNGGNTVSIVDISNPALPTTVSTVANNCAQGLDVKGRYMYVTNPCSGVVNIYDVSKPASVSLVKSYPQSFSRGLKAVGSNVYTLGKTFLATGKFAITNVNDPSNPITVASTTVSEPGGSYSFLDVQGSYAYLALSTANKLEIYDVSNPANPTLATSTLTATSPQAVKVQGRYAYVTTASNNYLQIYDVSNPTSPVLVKSVTVGSSPRGLDVSGRYAYVANSSANTVSIVDISSSTAASVVKSVSVGTTPHDVKVDGKYMYVTNRSSNTFTIYDVSGLETGGLIAGSAEMGNLQVLTNASVFNNFNIGGGLNVGQGGIYTNGSLGALATSTFIRDVVNFGSMGVGVTGTNTMERLQVEGNGLIRKRSSAIGNTWNTTGTSYTNAPSGRSSHAAVWTGSKMIVWGGANSGGSTNSGAIYDPLNDTWKTISTTGAPAARFNHTAVWTGSKMIVWGGYSGGGETNTGGIYDPQTDTWKTVTAVGAPAARFQHTAVWTGSKMIVWGGDWGIDNPLNDGGIYDPVTNSWSAITTVGAPNARWNVASIWTGSRMIVWGGQDGVSFYCDGGSYNPTSNSWTNLSTTNEPTCRTDHTLLWTGSKMLVWGGDTNTGVTNSGGSYDPVSNTWDAFSTTGAPSARSGQSGVWTGTRMLIWGGSSSGGGTYDPVADSWTTLSTTNQPSNRQFASTAWTGSRMIVWGGYFSGSYFNSGGIYTPSQYQGNIMAEGDMYIGGSAQVVGDVHAGGYYSKSGSDFAEYMPVDTALEAPQAGDVVVLSDGNRITKSSAATRRYMVGAITDRPAVVGNANPAFKDNPEYALVSMLGQVDVKFSAKNGPVSVGDYLMAGDDGYAVKAKGPGLVLGQALQAGDATSSILTYINPHWWAGDLLTSEGDANFVSSDLNIAAQGLATSSTTAFGSNLFSFQGSAWDEASQSAVPTSFSMRNDTVSPTSSFFTLSFATGTNAQSPVLSISNLGDVNVSGDLTVGRRLYLGSKTTGKGSDSTYIYVDDTLSPSSTYIATNADGWQTSSTYDYAERYESSEKLNPGDLVTSDNSGINKVKRATSSLEPILGIVSTKPGFITGGYTKDSYPIALAGRVPTRVSTANGAIQAGDYLTVSDGNPGLATKAVQSGNIVGIALESFDQPGEGLISVFVKPGYQNILNTDAQAQAPSTQAQSTGSGTGSVRSGLAKIYAGMREVKVTYESINAYPIINVRPYGQVSKHFWVIDASDRSFTIVVGEAPQTDVVFSWTVQPSQTGNAIFYSDDTSVPYDPITGATLGPTPPPPQETVPTNTETNSSTGP